MKLISDSCGTKTKELNQMQAGMAKGANQWQFGDELKNLISGNVGKIQAKEADRWQVNSGTKGVNQWRVEKGGW